MHLLFNLLFKMKKPSLAEITAPSGRTMKKRLKNQTPHLLKYPKRLLGQIREELERVAYLEIPNDAEKSKFNPLK